MKSIWSWILYGKYITIHSYSSFLQSLLPPEPDSHMSLLSLFHVARADLKAGCKKRNRTECKRPNSVFRAREATPVWLQRYISGDKYPFGTKGVILQKCVFLFSSPLEDSADQGTYWVLGMQAVEKAVFYRRALRCYLAHTLTRFIFCVVSWVWKRDEDTWMEARITFGDLIPLI